MPVVNVLLKMYKWHWLRGPQAHADSIKDLIEFIDGYGWFWKLKDQKWRFSFELEI